MERLSALLCLLIGVGIFVAAVLGPLGLGLVHFHMSRNAIVQYQGGDVVMIAIGVGLLGCCWMWWQQAARVHAITLGLSLFVIYTFVTVVLPQDYIRYPEGNVKTFMLLYFAITAGATMLSALSINSLMGRDLLVSPHWIRGTQWVMGVQAGSFLLMWLSQVIRAASRELPSDAADMPLLFWLIRYLDLGFVIPLTFLAVTMLRSQQPLAPILVLAVVGFTTCMLIAIAAMSFNQWRLDQAGGSMVLTVAMLILAIPSAAVWWHWVNAYPKA